MEREGFFAKEKTKNIGSILLTVIGVCVAVIIVLAFLLIKNEDRSGGIAIAETREETTLPSVTEFTAQDHYASVLEKYRLAIAEGWTMEQCEIEGISTRMQYTSAMSGYQIFDLNGDSREELVIGSGKVIWDLYTTLEDGTPVQLLSDQQDGWQFSLCENQWIFAEYSTKEECLVEYYTLEDSNLVMQEQLQCRDYQWMIEAGEQEWTYISEQEAQDHINSLEKITPEWQLFDPDSAYADTDTLERYLPVLEIYKTALTEKWDIQQCMDSGICYMTGWLSDNPEDLGACFLDLDEDGVKELLVVNGGTIYDLYVLKNGEPVLVLSGGERNHYALCRDNYIINHGSGSAFWSVFNCYLLRQGELILVESVISDYQQDSENPYFRSPDGMILGEQLTQDQADTIRDAYLPISVSATPVLQLG